ncbi:MAG: O-antigen ligase family protein [Oscillospiraceae bacterium]|nr:O-antigen ligase family protein [Oscillospiraceae bacterium]
MGIKLSVSLKSPLRRSFSLAEAVYFGLLLLYFRPANYIIGAGFYKLLSLCLIMVAAGLAVYAIFSSVCRLFLRDDRYYAPSFPVLMLALLFFWCMFCSSLINYVKGNPIDTNPALLYTSTGVGLTLLSDIGLTKRPKAYLRRFMGVGSMMCMLNNLTIFVFKSSGGFRGDTKSWRGFGLADKSNFYLLAEDNASFFWAWPVLIAVWCYYYLFDRSARMKRWAIIYTAVTVGAYLYAWSMMAMLCFLATVGLLYLSRRYISRRKKPQLKLVGFVSGFNLLVFAALFVNYLISVVQIVSRFSYFLEHYLHKSANLSGRVQIWNKALRYIRTARLIGFGNEAAAYSEYKISINHTHNLLLETMYRGGIIGIVILLVMLFALGIRGKKVESEPLYKFLALATALFIMFCSFEFAFYRYPYVIVLVLIAHTELFHEREQLIRKLNRG